MKIAKNKLTGHADWLAVVILIAALGGVTPGCSQEANTRRTPGAAAANLPQAPQPKLPSPWVRTVGSKPAEIALATDAQVPAESQESGSASANQKKQQAPQKPVGAAAAPPESAIGVTASRPAGAVIAPAKQRRARAILIRVALIAGAGVAIGTVLMLTHATPSQPQ